MNNNQISKDSRLAADCLQDAADTCIEREESCANCEARDLANALQSGAKIVVSRELLAEAIEELEEYAFKDPHAYSVIVRLRATIGKVD